MELVVRLVEALAWPFVGLLAIVFIRPGRLVKRLIDHGGRIGVAGVTVDVPNVAEKITEVVESVGEPTIEEEAQSLEGAVSAETPQDSYRLIMNSWSELADAMLDVLKTKTGEEISLRQPRDLIEKIQKAGLIGSKVFDEIEQLLDVRQLVKRNGPAGFEKLELRQEDARRYAASAAAIRKRYFR